MHADSLCCRADSGQGGKLDIDDRDSLQYEKAMSDEKIEAKLTAAVSGAG